MSTGSPSTSPPHHPQFIYAVLTTYLTAHTHSILSIEILPSSYPSPNLLADGTNLGLPKKSLVQAFLIARQVLFSRLHDNHWGNGNEPSASESSDASLEAATKILLLYNPEHLTAANARKHHLRSLLPTATSTSTSPPSALPQPPAALTSDLAFSTTLLTSPLPRHAKSPTLWSHRYWLLKTYRSALVRSGSGSGAADGNSTHQGYGTLLEEEISTVLRAGERHPANYHAFLYARRIVLLLERQKPEPEPETETETETEDVRARITNTVHKWCLAHPRDISGWGFLAFWLDPSFRFRGGESQSDSEMVNQTVLDAVIQRTEAFVRDLDWRGKSVQWFLSRMKLRGQGIQEAEHGIRQTG
ncbi:MAG: hypothetical protein Q9187_000921 [Circinaria calcarea]